MIAAEPPTANDDEPINYFPDVEVAPAEIAEAPAIAKPDSENKPKSTAKSKAKPLCQAGLDALEKAKKQGLEAMGKQPAGELGQSRGYDKSVDGFCQMCRYDNPDKAFNLFDIVYDRESKQYFDVRSVKPGQ